MGHAGNGIVIGTVSSLDDTKGLYRVKVKLAHLGEKERWCRVVTLMAGAGRGSVFTPEVGDEVLVAYRENCPDESYVLGGIWSRTDKRPPGDGNTVQNNWRFFASRSGHVFKFDDTAGKEKIEIVAKDGKQKVVIDNATKKIRVICDDGDVEVTATNGAAKVRASRVDLTSTGDMLLEATGTITIRGATVDINP